MLVVWVRVGDFSVFFRFGYIWLMRVMLILLD